MEHVFFVGLGLCIGCIILSRVLSERNYRKLTAEQKDLVMDGLSSMRLWNLIPVVLVIGLYLGETLLRPASLLPGRLAVFGIMVAAQVVRHLLMSRKFKALQAPGWYVRGALISSWLYNIGLLAIIAGLILPELTG